jgi:hypothetical protein
MNCLFEVHIIPGHTAEHYAAAWARVSEILQRAPGARGTRNRINAWTSLVFSSPFFSLRPSSSPCVAS